MWHGERPTSQATQFALGTVALRVAGLTAEIITLGKQPAQLVQVAAPQTLDLVGVRPEHAAQLLTAGGNPDRLRSSLRRALPRQPTSQQRQD